MPDQTPGASETPTTTPPQAVASALTDGTGISRLVTSKIVKDLVLDFLITAGASLVAINVVDVSTAVVAPLATGTALLDAAIRVGIRAIIRWAQTP